MIIGVPKEKRAFEYRVGLTPPMVNLLNQHGHTIFIEHEAGRGAGFSDQDYEQAGARIVYSAEEVFGRADLLLKVARPLLDEIEWLRPGSTLAGFLHLASARKDKVEALLSREITAIAYEQIQLVDGSSPVLKPLSQIGGRLTAQIGARLLQNNSGGKGILLGGVAGVPPAEVVIIGAGVLGTCAAQGFLGMGAHVTVLDSNLGALQKAYDQFPGIVTMVSNPVNLKMVTKYGDIVVCSIRVHGQPQPLLITREMVQTMKPRSVIMDISIDEGGSVETSRPTTHEKSYYIEDNVIHYCVPNIPSVVACTSTYAFGNAAYPYIQDIANKGIEKAIQEDHALELAINTHHGKLIHLNQFSYLVYPE